MKEQILEELNGGKTGDRRPEKIKDWKNGIVEILYKAKIQIITNNQLTNSKQEDSIVDVNKTKCEIVFLVCDLVLGIYLFIGACDLEFIVREYDLIFNLN